MATEVSLWPGTIIFSYLTDFSYFPLKINFWMLQELSEQVKSGGFDREV